MRNNQLFTIAALVASAFASTAALASPIVKNGSFEASSGNGACAAGWTCSNSGNFGVEPVSFWNGQMAGANLNASPNGGNVVASWYIDSPDTISQMLTGLTVGSRYNLSFDVASANREATTTWAGLVGWKVSVGGSTLGTANVAIAAPMSGTPWSVFDYSFVATSAHEALKFLSVSSVAVAPEPLLLLDGVSVTAAVPEPTTWALLAAGLLAVGSITRRRRASQV